MTPESASQAPVSECCGAPVIHWHLGIPHHTCEKCRKRCAVAPTQEVERLLDEIDVHCAKCQGDGFTVEHNDPCTHSPETGECMSCPIQVQCEHCQATGLKNAPAIRAAFRSLQQHSEALAGALERIQKIHLQAATQPNGYVSVSSKKMCIETYEPLQKYRTAFPPQNE